MQPIQNFSTWFSKQNLIAKVVIGGVALFLLCCLCSIPIAIFSPSTPTPQTADVSSVQTAAVETVMAGVNQTTVTNAPTNTLESTDTPAPTDTPLPPPTQNVGVVGERRESGGIALTVLGVSKAESIDFFTPDAGNVFLIIEVVIENVS